RTTASRPAPSPASPTTSKPWRVSMLEMPSRTRTSSSATTTRFPLTLAESLRRGRPSGAPTVSESLAITTGEARDSLRRLAEEQASLRRVATLVAQGVSAEELFAVAAEEVARVLGVPSVRIARYDPDATVVLGEFNYSGFPAGSVWPHDAPGVAKM